jgi:outer membrane protein insertion porin family
LGLRFRAENVDIDPDTDAPIEVWDAEGGNNIFGTKVVAIKNNTDSRYLPTKGDSYEVNYEQVFGDYNFGVVTGIYRWYKTLSEDLARRKTVLATKLQASSIIGDAPVFEKFYAGGTGSLRGFDYRGVSPRGRGIVSGEYDDPIGSDWLMLANAEITVPLSSDTFNWLFFCDTGMVDDNEFRSAVGTGIEILLPQWFGPVPMRFELAAPITKDESDDTNVFSFSMGRLF